MIFIPFSYYQSQESGIGNAIYAGAKMVLALRKLVPSYNGACIRVRRGSDNQEQDIGFTSTGALDVAALAAFCGNSIGYVTKWYCQKVFYDFVFGTVSQQPIIYQSNAVIIYSALSGKYALASHNNSVNNTNTSPAQAKSFNFNGKLAAFAIAQFNFDTTANWFQIRNSTNNTHIRYTRHFHGLTFEGTSFSQSPITYSAGAVKLHALLTDYSSNQVYAEARLLSDPNTATTRTASSPSTSTSTTANNVTLTIPFSSPNNCKISDIIVWDDFTASDYNTVISSLWSYYV